MRLLLNRNKKWAAFVLFASVVSAIYAYTMHDHPVETNSFTKAEQLAQLRQERADIIQALNQLPQDQLDKQKELGRTLKNLEAQIGPLEDQLEPNPEKKKLKIESRIGGSRAGLGMSKQYFESLDPSHPDRDRGLAFVQMRLTTLAYIENDYLEGRVSLDETLYQIDQATAIKFEETQ